MMRVNSQLLVGMISDYAEVCFDYSQVLSVPQ